VEGRGAGDDNNGFGLRRILQLLLLLLLLSALQEQVAGR
jgi:hypothetical protein